MKVNELIELLEKEDPMAEATIETLVAGHHSFNKINGVKTEIVKSTEVKTLDWEFGKVFKEKILMSCSIEKPNAFKVVVLSLS